ncbi:Hypothetical predicted protein [Octopus vulgaris]|uniref:Uncharacterized protein n=1 Tax=Octopus vulgaris TaxID=6645 RepID=A0AA36FI50_OCTVU|nr:Hypothetical predicted protein [Octopus vulgaris]
MAERGMGGDSVGGSWLPCSDDDADGYAIDVDVCDVRGLHIKHLSLPVLEFIFTGLVEQRSTCPISSTCVYVSTLQPTEQKCLPVNNQSTLP